MTVSEQMTETKSAAPPLILRSRVLQILGWTLLALSIVLLTFHLSWMWRRMGSGAPIVGFGLLMDALVGIGLIVAGRKARQKHQAQKEI